jgi:hypothetical protein
MLVRCLDQSRTEACPETAGSTEVFAMYSIPSIGLTRTKPTGCPSASATITSPSASRFAAIDGVSAANEQAGGGVSRARGFLNHL